MEEILYIIENGYQNSCTKNMNILSFIVKDNKN